MRKKRLLILIPNLGTGGAQKVYRQQLSYLAKEYEVVGCVFNWDGSFEEDRTQNMYSLDVPAGTSTLNKVWCFLQRIWRLRKLKKSLGVDVSISHLEGADYVNLLSRGNDKVICWIHGTKKHDGNIEGALGWIRKEILIPFTYGRADKIITVSDGIRHELEKEFRISPSSMTTIQNGFDVQLIERLSSEEVDTLDQIIFQQPVIITHCRLAVQKNLVALLRVFALMQGKTDAKLVLVGDGELRQILLDECRKLKLRTYNSWEGMQVRNDVDVYFIGYKPNPYRYIAKATLYAMTSGWEGFPLSLCEAMACGLPVVSTDCFTGPKEILAPDDLKTEATTKLIKGKYGYLLPLINPDSKQDVDYWSNSLQKILANPDEMKFVAAEGKKRIADFNINETIRLTIQAIESIHEK